MVRADFFVAHEIVGPICDFVKIEGLLIKIDTITFREFFEDFSLFHSENIEKYLLKPLQEQRTPNEVRQKLLASI